MAVSFDTRVVRPSDILMQELEGESVFLHLERGQYLGLDEVATRMWEALVSSESIQAAYDSLLGEFDVEPEQLRRDLEELRGEAARTWVGYAPTRTRWSRFRRLSGPSGGPGRDGRVVLPLAVMVARVLGFSAVPGGPRVLGVLGRSGSPEHGGHGGRATSRLFARRNVVRVGRVACTNRSSYGGRAPGTRAALDRSNKGLSA